MKEVRISSDTNSHYKNLKSLLSAKGIKAEKSFLLSGEKIIKEFLADLDKSDSTRFEVLSVITDEKSEFRLPKIPTVILSAPLFNELDILGTHYPLLQLRAPDIATAELEKLPVGLELICPFGDPKNLGALARSALAFGCTSLILTKESTHPFLPQAIKASAGAILKLNLVKSAQPTDELTVTGENYALDLAGKKINQVQFSKNIRLWVGEEGPGLKLSADQKKKITRITISTQGVESLNASVSAGIAIWSYAQQHQPKS